MARIITITTERIRRVILRSASRSELLGVPRGSSGSAEEPRAENAEEPAAAERRPESPAD
jgi:hypothetical protein